MESTGTGMEGMAAAKVGVHGLVEIPTDRARSRHSGSALGNVHASLDPALCGALATLAAGSGVSLQAVLLAGWLTLIRRLSGQADLAIGVASTQGAHNLPLRVELAGSLTVSECLALVDAQLHAVRSTVALPSDPAAMQLSFDVVMHPAPARADSGAELALNLELGQDQVRVRIRYAEALFDESTVQRHLGYWRNLLKAMAAGENLSIDRLALIDCEEREDLLSHWSRTETGSQAAPAAKYVHALFEAQTHRTPQAIAVSAKGCELSYAALNERANRLAHHLRSLGVAADDRVSICLSRGLEMAVAVLAVLKAGGAYVPLDPAYPVERLGHMVKDSAPKAILSERSLRSAVQGFAAGTRVLELDDDAAWKACPSTDLDPEQAGLTPDHLAYLIYTSGSTGMPKGVMVHHAGVCHYLQWAAANYAPHAGSVVSSSLSFDATVTSLFTPWLVGGEVTMLSDQDEIEALRAWMVSPRGNGLVKITPAHLELVGQQMLAAGEHSQVGVFVVGGEALSPATVRLWRGIQPGVRIVNEYGPTETVVGCVVYDIPIEFDAVGNVPIGRPLPHMPVYLVDGQGEPVPVGVVGEIEIGGPSVARGYLGRAELTATRFVADTFSAHPAARRYRTGDLARWLPDGNIEFLGRNDFQVKIRGFRIELGEIEARLLTHPQVGAAAVLAHADANGEKRLVAYYVPSQAGATIGIENLRNHLGMQLPEYMVPALYVRLDSLPLTPNGKLDRSALPEPGHSRPELAIAYEPPTNAQESEICAGFALILAIDRAGRHDNFFDLGGNSLLAMRLLEHLRKARARVSQDADAGKDSGTKLSATTFFRHPTPAGLAEALSGGSDGALQVTRVARGQRDHQSGNEPIAIVAMAGRFPGAADVEGFWQNLCEGRDSITHFKPEELDPWVSAADRADPDYVAARGIIDGLEQFDAAFFGIGPREAELMDPQQRIFLELCWECLERGGYVPDATPSPVGVFAGMSNATYFQHHVSQRPDLIAKLGAFQVMVNNEKDYIATRVAHKLNLTGPAISTHTACSTSLVAICQAVESLRNGQCDMALAGAASATCPPRSGYRYSEGAMLSPDGHTRTFDKDARGTVFSDGAAVVLLKRLSDALADGDQVFAVIRGAAINNDGGQKASFTAPSSEGQAAVIAMAHADAGIEPRSISYVEAHGTATPLGDPIEIEGLTKAFRLGTQDTGFCRVGSVKSNVGHLVIAAGAAGVIKTAYALQEERIPGTAHFTSPNPSIDFASSPFRVSGKMSEWKRSHDTPRRAGVSSFGVGGTNAHVVMEEAPELAPSESASGPQLLVLSARTPAALSHAAARLADHLVAHADSSQEDINLADVAWTLATGRKAFPHRLALAAADVADAIAQLRSGETASAIARSRPAHGGGVVFLFPGQGSQYAGMGSNLYATETAFRDAFDACAEALLGELRFDLRDVVFGEDGDALLPTSVMQPAIFSIEYALARLWISQGVTPVAMIGHSVGEFVAATLGGVFDLSDALRLVARRGRMMQSMPAGGMLSVRLPMEALLQRLPADLSLAAENAPGACVVAGSHEAVARFQQRLEADGIACRALQTSHAFHSAMMDPVLDGFRAEVEAVPRSAPSLPIVSTATGDWLDDASAISPDYWARHLREPVRFATAVGRVLEKGATVLLEIGPRTTLATLSRQHPGVQKQHVVAVSSLADSAADEAARMRSAFGQLWACGIAMDPAQFDQRKLRRRVRLPTYPFERQRYWVEAPPASLPSNVVPHPAIAARAALEIPVTVLNPAASNPASIGRKPRLVAQLKEVFEDVAGFDLNDADNDANFMELGLDSLMLTQVALQLQKTFSVKITFRQLMSECSSLGRLSEMLDAQLPQEAAPAQAPAQAAAAPAMATLSLPAASTHAGPTGSDYMRQVIDQQMQLMSQQLALLAGSAVAPAMPGAPVVTTAAVAAPVVLQPAVIDEEAAIAHTRYDVKKAFGAIARIDNSGGADLSQHQRQRLDGFMQRYIARTAGSRKYTEQHRAHMADPRVVNGFRPLTKEIIYQIVIERSRGSHLWDIDGNEYVDALNGFGSSLFGWQPDFVIDAVKQQLEQGYEIGPQHPLAGDVAKLICELTGHDRAALCNTGSEAVLGAMRIARTITGRETVVIFTGAYHGINDEVIVRGTKKLKAVPAAPGILRNTAEHVLVLDYGTPESLQIIRERAQELAAVLVEPVQSRRPDFQPVEFLKEIRQITSDAGAVLIFDEVITGFRSHPGGTQALFGIKADLATYGKVIGGGYPIGAIAGKRAYLDALDGGHWEYGDDSTPTVGVTYFAGTFVRHPLTLAAAKASLQHMKEQGVTLQQRLSARTAQMVEDLNAFCDEVGAPITIVNFASMWRTRFDEDHPLQDLLFAMMRSRGIHILDNFPCFFTTAHSEADFRAVTVAYKESLLELQEAGFIPGRAASPRLVMDAARPVVAGARLGRDPDGSPAWYVDNPAKAGKFLKVGA